MATLLKILWCLFVADILLAHPISDNQNVHNECSPEECGDYFEGDMELDFHQMSAILYPNQRNALKSEKYRWPGNVVFYEIDPIFGEEHIAQIRLAFDTIEQSTCVKFAPRRKSSKGYIYVKGDSTGCHAAVGYRGNKQILNLHKNEIGKGCFKLGTIMHELIHSLGFYHQHSTFNRDNYVSIIRENIKEGKENNFLKYPVSLVTNLGVKYDYESIMHYSEMAFSKNGKKTIVPHDKRAKIGQRIGLSEGDIKKINTMYKCRSF